MSSQGSEESSEEESNERDADWTPDDSGLSGVGGGGRREGPARSRGESK